MGVNKWQFGAETHDEPACIKVASPLLRERRKVRVDPSQSCGVRSSNPHLNPLPLPKERGGN
jgi:hypothetical protein